MRFKIYLTGREWTVLIVVSALLALGWAVKSYRLSHASPSTVHIN